METPDTHLELASAQFLAHLQSGINRPLQVPLQTTAKVPEHSGTPRENDVLHTGNWDVRAATWQQAVWWKTTKGSQGWLHLWKCSSSPYREDAWRQWGSSGWPHPPLQRWAGWSPGWQTGIVMTQSWCVTLCCIHTQGCIECTDWPQGGRRSQAPGTARSPHQWWTLSCWWHWCRCTAWSTWNRPCRICWTLSPDLGTRS